MTDDEKKKRQEFTDGLRAMADFLDAHPEVPMPSYNTLTAFVSKKEEVATAAKAGSWNKEYTGDYFFLTKSFGDNLRLQIATDRTTVCRKVITGTKIVPARPEQEVETFDWVCEEQSLLAGGN